VTFTWTDVHYFDDDDVAPLRAGLEHLEEEASRRRPYISKHAAEAIEHRLELLRHASALLLEPVPKRFE
jgi:hypothetical protein